jgi:hypothetical protein
MSEISAQIHTSMQTFTAHTFMPFLTKQSQDLTHSQQEFLEVVDGFHCSLVGAEGDLGRLHQLHETQKQDLVVEEARTAELERQVSALELSASTLLPNQVAALSKSLASSEVAAANLSNEVSQLTRIHSREIDAVTRGVAMFRERLGVTFQVQEGKLQIAFAYIERDEPHKPFTIAIFVDENKEYQLHACTPQVDTIQQLVDELNRSNNFAKFIGQVRKQFVQLVAQTNPQE